MTGLRLPRAGRAALLLFALASVAVFVMLTTGLGPDQRLKLALGMTIESPSCTPSAGGVRNPPGSSSLWQPGPPLPGPRDEIRAATANGVVYVGTGIENRRNETGYLSVGRMYSFEPERGTFQALPDAPRRVDHPLLVADQGDVYVVGGFEDGQPTARAWRFSPESGEWTELAPMPTARGGLGGAVIGDELYAVGGAPGTSLVQTSASSVLEILDLRTGRWRAGPPMRFARHHVGAAAVDGVLYVAGGRSNGDLSVAHAERFDPARGRWETLPPLPQGSGGLAGAAAGGRFVAIGGGDDEEEWVTGATWSIGPGGGGWQREPTLAQARHGHGAAVVGDRVYVFGGAPCAGIGSTDSVEMLDLG